MGKNVLISEELFIKLLKHHLFELSGFEEDIQKGLLEKMESMSKRSLYTKSKTAATKEEREKYRLEYLDLVGMRDSYRWKEGFKLHH